MRPSIVLACALVTGCATLPATVGDEPDCITVINTTAGSQLYLNGERVIEDDLVTATEDSPVANVVAIRSRVHDWFAIGSLVVGSVLLAPGIGLLAGGTAQRSSSDVSGGAVLTGGGVGGIIAGALLMVRSRAEGGRAIDTYNEQRHHCRPGAALP